MAAIWFNGYLVAKPHSVTLTPTRNNVAMEFSPVESGAIALFSDPNPKKRCAGKRKIDIQRIDNFQSRMVCFSKRRRGLFKKAGDLASLTGADIAILVRSQADRFYTYGSASFDSTVDRFLSDNGSENETENQSLPAVIDGDSTQWRPLVCFDVDSCEDVGRLGSFLYQVHCLKNTISMQRLESNCHLLLE